MKKFIAMVLAMAMVLSLAACSGSAMSENTTTAAPETTVAETTAAESKEEASEADETTTAATPSDTSPIKVGLVCDQTGNEATTGEETIKALQFAIEYFGGQICGRDVELVIEDAQGDAATAADVTRKMVEEDGVSTVFGPTQAGQKASVVAYCDEAEVPLIFGSGTPSYLFDTSDWLIGSGGANPQMTSVMADYAYNTLGYKKVHILTMDNTGFRTFADDFAASFKALGGEIAEEYYVPFSVGDWSSYFTAMSTDGVDGIMAWSTGATAISMWKSYSELGMDQKLPITAIMSSAFTDYYIGAALEAAGSGAAESIIGTVAPTSYCYDIDSDENAEFVEAWEAEFGEVPNTNLSGLMFDAYQVFMKAVEACGGETSDLAALRDAMMAEDFTGVTGHIAFPESGAATRDTFIVEVVKLDDGSYNYHVIDVYEDVPGEGLTN